MKNKFICFLLLIIIIGSSVLIYKINQTTAYDPEIYNQVYSEFEEITKTNTTTKIDISSVSSSIPKETIYISKNESSTNRYKTSGVITISKINVSYPVINDYSEENLNIAPTKFAGPEPNTIGNFVIVGHNNWNKSFFSNLHKLEKGDIVELTDTNYKKLTYKIQDKYEVDQYDFSCLNQDTNGKIELTLITCIKNQKNKRLIIKCIAD